MTTPTRAQFVKYERIARQDSTPPAVREALHVLMQEVMESHTHRAVQAQQIVHLSAEVEELREAARLRGLLVQNIVVASTPRGIGCEAQ